jgi:hypothetical protein
MPRGSFAGDKRRREKEKKRKREEKLKRKQNKGTQPQSEDDTSYLEYLHPGGVPDELLPDSEDSGEEEDDDEND